jgi:predicted phage tail protein
VERIVIHNPFQRQNKEIKPLKVGDSLATICWEYLQELKQKYNLYIDPQKADEFITVSVNGNIIPMSFWGNYHPLEGDQILIMPVVGKGDSEKQILNIVAMIAVLVYAPQFAQGLSGATAAEVAAGTAGMGYTIAYVSTVVVGGVLISSLSPKPKTQASSQFDASETSQTFGWNPTTLQRQGLSVARMYGLNRLYGVVAAAHTGLAVRSGYPNDTTNGESNDQRLFTLIPLGMGPIQGILQPPSIGHVTTGTIGFNSNGSINARWRNVSVVDLPDESTLYSVATWSIDIGTHPAINNWTATDIGTDHAPGNWDSVNGFPDYVEQKSNITGPNGGWDSPLQGIGGTILTYDNGTAWTDYKWSFDMQANDDDTLGFMFRYVDTDNHYRFIWNNENSTHRMLIKRKNGVDTLLWSDQVSYNTAQWYSFIITCQDTAITLSIDGDLIVDLVDSDPEIRINDQNIVNFRNVSWDSRNGLLSQDHISFFDKTKIELTPATRIISGAPFIYETPDSDFDELEVDITFLNGLYDATGASIDNQTVQVKIEVKKTSEPDSAYITITQPTENIIAKSTSKVIRTYNTIRRTITNITQANPGVVTCSNVDNLANGDSILITDVVGMVEVNNFTRVIANLNPVAKTFEIEDTSGYTAYTSNGVAHKDIPIEFGNAYNIKVTKVTSEANNPSIGDDLYLDRVREVIDSAFSYPRTALVGINALATDQLSGTIRFSCLAKGLFIRVYDDTTQTWSIVYNTNPAWVLHDIFTQPVYSGSGTVSDPFVVERYEGKDPSDMDLDKFVELADFCDQVVDNPNKINIFDISQATEALVTTMKPHNYYPDDVVVFDDIYGMIEITDGTQAIVQEVINSTQFTINIDTSGYTKFAIPTQMLLHFNGTDAAQSSSDSSVFNHLLSFWGTAQLDTAEKKWGSASLLLDGNSDYLTIPDSSSLDIAETSTDDWTIDLQVKHDDHAGSEIYLQQYEDASNYWVLKHENIIGLSFEVVSGGSVVVQCGGVVQVSQGTGTAVGTMTDGDPPQGLDDAFDGTLHAGYHSAGCSFESNVATAKIGKFWTFLGRKIIYKCICYASSDKGFCETDATYELKLYGGFNGDLSTGKVLLGSATGTDANNLQIEIVATAVSTAYTYHWVEVSGVEGNNNDKIMSELEFFEAAPTSINSEITDTNWHHVALCKVADEWGIYLDGAQKSYTQDSSTDTFAGDLYVGASGVVDEYFDGHLDEIRISKSNVFSAAPNNTPNDSITVPTEEYTVETPSTTSALKRFIEFNGVFDEESTVWEAALKVCSLARCIPIPIGNKISLAINKSNSIIIQSFSPGIIKPGTFRLDYLSQSERASEIEIHYRDALQDYERVPFTIFNTDIVNVTNKIRIDLFGITDARMAEEAGDFQLLKNQLLTRMCSFQTDVNAIHCTIGDRIKVHEEITNFGEMTSGDSRYGGGGLVLDGTNVTNATVTVDRKLQFIPALGGDVVYQILIGHGVDDSTEIKTVTHYNEDTNVVTIDGVFDKFPMKDDVWAIGKQNQVARDYQVLNLKQSALQKITIEAIEYTEALYAGDP